jgi:hypothetical protein
MHNATGPTPRRPHISCDALLNATHNESFVLWRLHGARHELVCTTIITSFGYALHLALAGEPILLELQRTVEDLTNKATRLESWLLDQGWTPTQHD